MSNILTFKISIPHTNGFFGRECNNPECKRYFKIHKESLKDDMYCPYCGKFLNKNQLWTKEQLHHAEKNAYEEGMKYVSHKIDNILEKTFGKTLKTSSRGFMSISSSYKRGSPYIKSQIPPPREKEVDSEVECSQCKAMFQVYGIFGYCPLCKYDNIIIYDTNISIILTEIDNAQDKNRALRYAYNDLVATFEGFCKKRNHTGKKYNFQDLNTVRRFFKNTISKDIFNGIQSDELLTIKRLFQKRHAYQHNKGKIDQKYIHIIPEDEVFLNTVAVLCLEEFKEATEVLRKMLLNVI